MYIKSKQENYTFFVSLLYFAHRVLHHALGPMTIYLETQKSISRHVFGDSECSECAEEKGILFGIYLHYFFKLWVIFWTEMQQNLIENQKKKKESVLIIYHNYKKLIQIKEKRKQV